MTTIYL